MTSPQLSLPGFKPEPLRWCAMCSSWLPPSCFYPRYRNNHGSGGKGGSGYCRECHLREGRRRR